MQSDPEIGAADAREIGPGRLGAKTRAEALRPSSDGEDAIGRLRLKIVVPITEWKPRYASFPWFVYLTPTPTNGLMKDSGADAFQVKSVSQTRFVDKLGVLTPDQLDDIANAIAICVGAP